MAESLELQRANKGTKRVKLATFGATRLSFLDVPVVDVMTATKMVKSTKARKYTIETDGRGSVEIEHDSDDRFSIALHNNSRWVTTIQIEAGAIHVGNMATARGAQVSTTRILTNEPRNVHATFKIDQREPKMLKRIDVKSESTTWFSIFSHATDVLMVRPNGNWTQEKLTYLTDQIATQAINNHRRSEGLSVLPSNETVVMQRRQVEKVEKELAERKRASEREKAMLDQETAALAQLKKNLHDEREALKREAADAKQQLVEQKRQLEQEAAEILARKRALEEEKAMLHRETADRAEPKKVLHDESAAMEREIADAKQQLIEQKQQLEQEAAEIQLMAARSAAVKKQYVYYRTERAKLVNEVKAAARETEKVNELRRELQEAQALLLQEAEYLDSLRTEVPPLRETHPWSRIKSTGDTLTSRFTNRVRLVIRNGKIELQAKPTSHE